MCFVDKSQDLTERVVTKVLSQVGIFMSHFHFSHELLAHGCLVMAAMKHAAFMFHVLPCDMRHATCAIRHA
jgi:tRNA splicing ligase